MPLIEERKPPFSFRMVVSTPFLALLFPRVGILPSRILRIKKISP